MVNTKKYVPCGVTCNVNRFCMTRKLHPVQLQSGTQHLLYYICSKRSSAQTHIHTHTDTTPSALCIFHLNIFAVAFQIPSFLTFTRSPYSYPCTRHKRLIKLQQNLIINENFVLGNSHAPTSNIQHMCPNVWRQEKKIL